MAFTGEEKRIILVTDAAHAMVHMAMVTFAAVLLPMRLELGVGLFAISLVGNISYFSFGLLAPLSGWLTDRLGSRAILAFCFGGMAAASVAVALSPTIHVLGVALGALGLAAALYHPAALSLIARRVRTVERGMAWHGIFGSVGVALGPLVAGSILAFANWRWAYAALALPCAILAFVFMFMARGVGGQVEAPAKHEDFPKQTQFAPLIVYYAVALCIGFTYNGGTTFLPTHLGSMKNLFIGNAATAATLMFGVLGQYLGGWLGGRFRHEFVLAGALVGCGVGLLGLGYANGPWLLPPAVLFGLAYFATQPMTNTIISRLTSAKRQGMAYGINFFLTFGLGSLGTSVTGYIGERFRIAEAFRLLGAVAFAAVPATIFLWWLKRQMNHGREAMGAAR